MSDYVKEFQKGPEKVNPIHKPGDEGPCPELGQGESHPSEVPQFLKGPGGLEPSVGFSDAAHKPGEEGGYPANENVQGNRDMPPAAVPGEFLQGPEVRKTRVMPAHGDAGAGMGKGA